MGKENNRFLFIDKYLLNTFNFKLFFIIATLFTAIPYVHGYIGSYVKYGLAYGIVVCIWMFITGKLKSGLKSKANWLLLAFAFSYLISIFINRDLSFSANINQFVYMVVFFLLFCIADYDKPYEQLERELKIISHIFIIIVFIFSAIGFYMYLNSITGVYKVPGEPFDYFYGVHVNRLWGVYNPNTGAPMQMISIGLSIVLISYKPKWPVVVLNVLNIVLQFWSFLLAASRGSTVGALAILAFACCYIIYKKFFNNKTKLQRFVITALSMILIVSAVLGISLVTKTGLSYLPSIYQKICPSQSVSMAITTPISYANSRNETFGNTVKSLRLAPSIDNCAIQIEQEDINRTDTEGDVSSGRFELWGAGIKVFLSSPLFGVTQNNIDDLALGKYIQKGSTLEASICNGGLHNIYVTILAASGICGFALMMCYIIVNLLKELISLCKNIAIDRWQLYTFLTVVMMLITELVEARILYKVSIFNVLFWMMIGYSIKLTIKKEEVIEGNHNG